MIKTTKNKIQKSDKVDTNSVEVIRWKDALSDHGWSDTREAELADVLSVGFLIAENKEAVMIATTWAEPESNGRMNIPKGWIKSRKKVSIQDLNKTSPTKGIYNPKDGVL